MRITGLGLLPILIAPLIALPFADETVVARVTAKYGSVAKNRFIYLNETLEKLRGKSDREKLEGVNDFFNGVPYASDLQVYRQKDYWATPWEFLGRDRGDCEDYVIAKYFALKHLGIDPKKLFFTYVKSRRFREPHMVLTYFETPRSIPLVLDNTNYKIFPADQRTDLIPIYNFNGDSLYLARHKGLGEEVTSHKSHKQWDQLLINIQRNKI